MSNSQIYDALNETQKDFKKISGVNVVIGDPDPGASEMPIVILTPEDSGEITQLAQNNYNIIIPLRVFIRVDKTQTQKAYMILEKIIKGLDNLRSERGYTIGTDPETGGQPRGELSPTYDERGFFELSINFKIDEIIQNTEA